MAIGKLVRRLAELIAVLIVVSFGTFMLVSLMDADPAVTILGEGHSEEEYAAVRTDLGLDDSLVVRYGSWLGAALTGDLGSSVVPPYSDVMERIAAALPVSVELAVLGMGMALLLSIPLAMWSAYHAGGRVDRIVSAGTFGVLSVPSFLAGLVIIMVFANQLGWFPRAEWARLSESVGGNLYHAFLPALTIALAETAMFTRILRNDLITTLREDFILSARAKGMGTVHILFSDALRPSSFSLMTLLGIGLGRLIGSTVIVEYLFALPGMGSLVIGAANTGDFTMVQGAVLIIAVIYVVTNALIDVSYGYLDPRIRRAHV
ncbi:peptide ABC transporter [Prauserella marina]|uniref:Peptide/nickel transport system permease protein n=1 Tax=Prauserella marina TaxID=530584 RepID=A0A222VZI6_9PSEU|nr:ABC transporter permease [Prauserella marina]ASR39337.1 peptide ABC transporter [Prauserella marina]PWV77034.1 peptide/nickel transport system permease protein [Prauserella marina]SDD02822.1 peptide/nickel transport system permease protein [Prauserella marina]